ncbi:MAG: hypothetical protein HPY45_04005 [Anaerolineae bacterium]|nr:hypothetical protein [Anaerolineae bacterium]
MTISFEQLSEYEKQAKPFALCTIVESCGSTPRHVGSKMVVFAEGISYGSIGGGEVEELARQIAVESLATGEAKLFSYDVMPSSDKDNLEGGSIKVFVEPMLPRNHIVVIGAGHIGKAVAWLAKWLGFHVTLVDDRPELCNREANPYGDAFIAAPMEEAVKMLHLTPFTSVVLATRSLDLDVIAIPHLLEQTPSYIGVLGSKKRWAMTCQALTNMGIAPQRLTEIHAPIGLDVGAETPEEIAISIMAEIIKAKKDKTGLK